MGFGVGDVWGGGGFLTAAAAHALSLSGQSYIWELPAVAVDAMCILPNVQINNTKLKLKDVTGFADRALKESKQAKKLQSRYTEKKCGDRDNQSGFSS